MTYEPETTMMHFVTVAKDGTKKITIIPFTPVRTPAKWTPDERDEFPFGANKTTPELRVLTGTRKRNT